jgi:hypothetical protein
MKEIPSNIADDVIEEPHIYIPQPEVHITDTWSVST